MSLLIESVPEHDREAVLNTPDEFGEYAVCRLLRLRYETVQVHRSE